eukprot:SAG11_NODE_4005_length_2111_cov_1.395626_3_plen_101_part_00
MLPHADRTPAGIASQLVFLVLAVVVSNAGAVPGTRPKIDLPNLKIDLPKAKPPPVIPDLISPPLWRDWMVPKSPEAGDARRLSIRQPKNCQKWTLRRFRN